MVSDRGYIDYDWFVALTADGVYLVTRLKENADYGVVERRPVPAGGRRWPIRQPGRPAGLFLRRIEIWVEEKNETWCLSPTI